MQAHHFEALTIPHLLICGIIEFDKNLRSKLLIFGMHFKFLEIQLKWDSNQIGASFMLLDIFLTLLAI